MTQTGYRRTAGRAITVWSLAVAIFAALFVGAPAASAAYSVTFSPPAGKVGVSQNLTASVASGAVGVAPGTIKFYASGVVVATSSVNATGAVTPVGWIPKVAGTIPMYAVYSSADASQTATSSTVNVAISKAATTTSLTSPEIAKIGATVQFSAKVTTGNAYVPTGTVTFLKNDGTPIQTQNMNDQGVSTISVIMPVTPSTYQIKARYNPDANTSGSTSETDSVLVTTTGSNMALSAPATTPVGKQITLTASVTPSSSTGTITFLLNGAVLGAQKIANGQATQQWTPLQAGSYNLVANYSADGTSVNGTATQTVTVVANIPSDTITVDPAGSAAPWIVGAGYPVRNGTSIAFSVTTASGATATLSVTGQCTVNGTTLIANAGNGACLLTAKSPGTAAYSAVTQQYTVTLILGVQTAQLTAPQSGTLRRGSSYQLSPANAVTNTNSPVSWFISSGKSKCRVTSGSGGTYIFSRKRGTCTATATAPAVANQWRAFKAKFKYRVR